MTQQLMLKERILSTLKFFDLQDYPLTLLELHKYLIADVEFLKQKIDTQGEIITRDYTQEPEVSIFEVLKCLDVKCAKEVQNTLGFYHLAGRGAIAQTRLTNYFFGIKREKLIKKYVGGLRRLPFIRGVALGGSQAMGLSKRGSDIDLLIITDSRFLWLGRTIATLYFQVLGKRRYGEKIADRFCLNHYLAGPKALGNIKNLYSAMEYARLRPLVGQGVVANFQKNNLGWIRQFFPQWRSVPALLENFLAVQKFLEKILSGRFGLWLESKLKSWQLPRIKKGKFIIVEEDELSFHPDSKQQLLLQKFFYE